MLQPEKIERLSEPDVQDYILNNLLSDPQKIALQKSPVEGLEARDIAVQVAARKKAQQKLPFWSQTKGIVFPESLAMEQCSSESTAQYKQRLFETGKSIVDLTGGFGIDSYWISEKADRLDYVERQSYLCDLATHNFEMLVRKQVNVINAELEDYLEQWQQSPTDYVFCDPARRNENQRKVFLLEDCSPDISVLAPIVLAQNATFIAKLSPMFDISMLVKIFGDSLAEIHVVAVKNECKELIVVLKPGKHETKLFAVNLESNQETIEGDYNSANVESVKYGEPANYLYEANAALMKAGVADLVAEKYSLSKLQQHSFLYTSNELYSQFPGRQFEIKQLVSLDKKELGKLIPSKKANISTRNFPMKPEEIQKKIGFGSGGEDYLFATTLRNDKKALIWCRKVISSEKN